jgi:hypothetical protein
MDFDTYLKLKEIVGDFTWSEAKTMRDKPHSYNVKARNTNKEWFEYLAKAIVVYGTPKKFYSMTIMYLEIDEYHYWTMDKASDNPNQCKLINRALIKDHNYNL